MANAKTTEINLQRWDAEINSKTADFEKLYKELLTASKETNANVEIWWRLSQVTFMMALNCTHKECCSPGDHGEVTTKTEEALNYAKKAVQMNPDHFKANLWMAYSSGKLALLASDMANRIELLKAFISSLDLCIKLNPNDGHVMLMQGRYHLALTLIAPEVMTNIREHLPQLPEGNLVLAEEKLRAALKQMPEQIDVYLSLVRVLMLVGKFEEAKEMIEKGLSLQCVTNSDKIATQFLKTFKSWLAEEGV